MSTTHTWGSLKTYKGLETLNLGDQGTGGGIKERTCPVSPSSMMLAPGLLHILFIGLTEFPSLPIGHVAFGFYHKC